MEGFLCLSLTLTFLLMALARPGVGGPFDWLATMGAGGWSVLVTNLEEKENHWLCTKYGLLIIDH